MALVGKSKKVIIRMSVLSVPIPRVEGSVSERASPIGQEKEKSANEMSGYRERMSIKDVVRKCLPPISENIRNRIWIPRELSVYSNSEFVCAIFPIAIALFWGKWGSSNCRVGAVVYDFRNSNTLSE